jgi:serine/threonine protein kinase/predicted ATPase
LNLTTDLTAPATPGPAAPQVAASTPTSFGRYEVRSTLGAGGFGAVYLGHDTQLGRPVAIKVLRGGSDVPRAEADQFLQEARRLAQLSHPGIVAIHDVGLDWGQIYIVSEFLDGPDLRGWLENYRPTWPEAAQIAMGVADALAHAHARLIVHRDIKPANIILTQDRGPVLVDFGLGLDEARAGRRELGVVSGTPVYMAPEQVAGVAHRIDGRIDIYSLGVVLYEMLCGHAPFRTTNINELMRQVRDDEPQPPRQVNREIPPELERVCLKALAKRLHDRYTTAADFAEDLRRVSQAAGPSSPTSARQFMGAMSTRGSQGTQSGTSQRDSVTSSSLRRRDREAERRQVTVLVCGCELFESASYLETLDAEDQSAVLRNFQHACEQAVFPFDGAVVQCNEQGLLACFGYPVAHEDAPRRAVRAGLGVLAQSEVLAAQLRSEHDLELKLRIGIHTGPAVVGTAEDAVSLVGEARNVAVRIEDIAEPGQIVITAATNRLIRGHFECTSLGPRSVKGASQPVELFLVQGIGGDLSPIEVAERAGLTPLTGRDHEISLLRDRWEQAQEGMGQVVLLVGEPGLGKSRLVHTIKQHVREQAGDSAEPKAGVPLQQSSGRLQAPEDPPVIEWRCSPHYQNSSLYPVSDFFERFLGFGSTDAPASRFDRLVRHLSEYGLARPDTVPLFAAHLSLTPDEHFAPLGLSPVREREESFRALGEWLRVYSERRPVLFIIEDLHWVDASTLEFLSLFLAEGLHDRILTLLTFRPEFQTPWPALAHQTSLALNRLTRRQVADLMRRKTGRALPEVVVDRVYDRTGGVPLFVEEFTKMVQESGVLDQVGSDAATVTTLTAHEIPASLQDLLMDRLERLEGDREVAQFAAVLGREFGYELLAAATHDEATLDSELAKLVQAEILYPKGRPPRCTYVFKHALLQDALYNALIKSKRQQFHRRIAELLEARFPEMAESQPELLGHHFTEAGLVAKAVGYWVQAGLRSHQRAAEREAIGQLTKGLALLETLEESRAHDEQKLKILTTLAPASIAVRGYAAPEVGPMLDRADELCQRIGDEVQRFGIMLGKWEWRLVRGDLRPSVDLAAEGMALAERRNDPGMLMEALFMRGVTMFYRAEFAEARVCYEQALAAYDDRARTRFWTTYTGHDSGVTHRCYLALVLWHLGYPDQALRLDGETQQLARTIGHAFSLGHAVDFTAFLCHYCRLHDELRAAAEEELAIGTDQGFQLWHSLGVLHKGAALLYQRRVEEALPLLLKGFGAFRATGTGVRIPAYLAMLGEAYTQARRFDEAHKALNEGLAVAEQNDVRCHEAELHRVRGELFLAQSPDQISDAENCFQLALETAQRHGSKGWMLRASTSLARLWQRLGRRDDAHQALAAVYTTYTEGFTTPDLVEARELLNG